MKTNHYFSEEQNSKFIPKLINIKLKKISFDIYTSSGVFSKSKLDKGTGVLINNCVVKNKWRVLDFGAGYGVVGIAIKKLYPETEVVMTEINKRAYKLAKMNVKLHKLDIKIKQGNLYEKVNKKFDTILVNPPQTAGKKVCFEIISGAKKHLKSKGLLQLVARAKKGGKQLSEFMDETFGNIEVIAKKSGYSVYMSKNE
jgi:16S rRNA (guanine1207-N2)-methyltransferase